MLYSDLYCVLNYLLYWFDMEKDPNDNKGPEEGKKPNAAKKMEMLKEYMEEKKKK